jgi:hypothetical protein
MFIVSIETADPCFFLRKKTFSNHIPREGESLWFRSYSNVQWILVTVKDVEHWFVDGECLVNVIAEQDEFANEDDNLMNVGFVLTDAVPPRFASSN